MTDRPISAFLPKQFQFWPGDAVDLQPAKISELYESGFAGAWHDPEAAPRFDETIRAGGGDPDGASVAHAAGLYGAASGRLVTPFQYVVKYFPTGWPGVAQARGSCVAHSAKNTCLISAMCDVASGKPDEVTGVVEGVPEVDPAGIKAGVFSTEAIYWYRGYDGDGWTCEDAASVVTSKSGLWLRNNYPDLGFDLRKYSGSLEGKYGRRSPPSEVTEYGKKHLIRTATRVSGFEQIADFLANGFGVSSCGGEGFSNQRDTNGVSKRSGSWAHAMAIIGADDRDVVKQAYGGPLVLILNSWGVWNSGPRRIMGTDIDIPEGSFWARWADVSRRTYIAFAGANGWAAKSLPPITLSVG